MIMCIEYGPSQSRSIQCSQLKRISVGSSAIGQHYFHSVGRVGVKGAGSG